MNHGTAAAGFADRCWYGLADVEHVVRLARDTYRLRLACPELARRFVPGQFLMIRDAGTNDPLLGRPMAMYDTVIDAQGAVSGIDIVFLVVGKLTRRLAHLRPGDSLTLWGPLGNGFYLPATDHVIMVAGGIGQTPFLALARECLGKRRYGEPPRDPTEPRRITLCYGARSAEWLAGVDDFRELGIDVRISTDDGSAGHHGLVTDLLQDELEQSDGHRHVVCCGPEPMLEAVARICQQRSVSCQVSLETPMACGLGICFSCVVRLREEDGSWDYRRTCIEGPVFDAARVLFAECSNDTPDKKTDCSHTH